jgi:lipopolysaccharide/colanic/teichoic acid biosynthesis glycosyltransferase
MHPAFDLVNRPPRDAGCSRATFPKLAGDPFTEADAATVVGLARDAAYGQPSGIAAWYLPVKVALEWTAALLLLIPAAPLVALFALLVKLTSPGPAFYFQTRLGLHGRAYRMCKIRTMRHNCEAGTGAVWAARNDSRVTAVGHFLRMTHLDELPQLLNVLKGEMSLIGPRPERPEMYYVIEREVPNYRSRLQVRPGVTGLAQMRLPADTEIPRVRHKLAYDLYYIRSLSPWLDLRISASTAFYFLAATAEALQGVAVGSYGKEVESHFADDEEYLVESA